MPQCHKDCSGWLLQYECDWKCASTKYMRPAITVITLYMWMIFFINSLWCDIRFYSMNANCDWKRSSTKYICAAIMVSHQVEMNLSLLSSSYGIFLFSHLLASHGTKDLSLLFCQMSYSSDILIFTTFFLTFLPKLLEERSRITGCKN